VPKKAAARKAAEPKKKIPQLKGEEEKEEEAEESPFARIPAVPASMFTNPFPKPWLSAVLPSVSIS